MYSFYNDRNLFESIWRNPRKKQPFLCTLVEIIFDALLNHVSFQLGEHHDDLKGCLAHRGRCVKLLVAGNKLNTVLLKLAVNAHKILQ